MGAFLERLPKSAVSTPGQRVCLASVLLMAVDPYHNPPYRPSPLQLAYKLTGLAAEQNDELPRYMIDFLKYPVIISDAAFRQQFEYVARIGAEQAVRTTVSRAPLESVLAR